VATVDVFASRGEDPMSPSPGTVATLQRFVDGFSLDVGRVRAALADDGTPGEARRTLVGALNYVLDALDIFPDHYQGLGLADDAIVLRLAAAQAVGQGAEHRGLRGLAADAREVTTLLGDAADKLDKLVAALAERPVKGRTPGQILADPDVRAIFEADLTRLLKRHQTAKIEPIPGGDDAVLEELGRMVRSALKREGLG
jgi:uncharacterized membrane protein YkvA (DUF1232 family)